MIPLITNDDILLVNLMFVRFQLFWVIIMMNAICLHPMHQFLMTWMTNYLTCMCMWSSCVAYKSCEGRYCVFRFFIFHNDHPCAQVKARPKLLPPIYTGLNTFQIAFISFDFYNIYNNNIIIFCVWILVVRNERSKEDTLFIYARSHN